jgi:hypothetical protein
LVAAAQVTTRPRLGTLVLNTGFHKPDRISASPKASLAVHPMSPTDQSTTD